MEATRRITAYFAYPVRGAAGDNVDISDKKENEVAAIALCNRLRRVTGWAKIYCPHEIVNEGVLQDAWRRGELTSQQIIDHCIEIVECCGVFVLGSPYDRQLSEGVWQECNAARRAGIMVFPYYKYADALDAVLKEAVIQFEIEHHLRRGAAVAPVVIGASQA